MNTGKYQKFQPACGFEFPPSALAPMGDDALKRTCMIAFMEVRKRFPSKAGAIHAIEAVGFLLRKHGKQFDSLQEMSVYLGLPYPKQ